MVESSAPVKVWGINNEYEALRDVLLGIPQYYRWVDAGPLTKRTLLNAEQLGPVTQEFTMRPGDAIYLRAGVPHRCITNAPFSLHMSFDLVDNSPRVMDITKAATNQYLYACELPYAPLSDVIDRYAGILKSTEFQSALVEATEFKRGEVADFRKRLGRTSAVKSLNKFS